jgi:hypothetical protein
MTSKHTSTPWELSGTDIRCSSGGIANVHDPEDPLHRTKTNIANAQHIVKCVNLHDELVEALERITSIKRYDANYTWQDTAGAIEIAEKALSKAKEV